MQTIRDLRAGAYATVIATVSKVFKRPTRRRQSMVTVTLSDGTGRLDLTFFNQPWLASQYKVGQELAVSGVVTLYRGRTQLANQEVELLRGDDSDLVHTGADHAGAPRDGGHHDADDPRARLHGARSASRRSRIRCPRSWSTPNPSATTTSAIRQIHFPDGPAASSRARRSG